MTVPASLTRVFWTALYSSLAALLIEHFAWFFSRSQGLDQAIGFAQVPVLMGLVCGVLAGGLAVAGRQLLRGKPAVIRYLVVAALAVVGALVGTLFFPAMFLYKWFTVPVIVVIVTAGMLLFTRDRAAKEPHPDAS